VRDKERAPGRWTLAGRVLLALGTAAALPAVWSLGDVVLHTALVAGVLAAVLLCIHRQRRPVPPDVAYAAALGRASAMRVELQQARVVAVHDRRFPCLVTVTWRGARTTLLDEDGRALAELACNGLTSSWTMSIPVGDSRVVDLLTRDDGRGEVSVYGTTDLVAHPSGNLRENGVTLDQYDLEFASWAGSLPAHPELADWEP
jgi:hypothetical protein